MTALTNPRVDPLLALVLTIIGAVLSWFLAGGLPLIGIDDAAITRSYAENLANGAGYVYNVGGERVEGSTAFLWASTLTLLYALTDTPEIPIIILCFALTVAAVTVTLRLARLLADRIGLEEGPVLLCLMGFLVASPGYFLWTVWTMMEVALWSLLLLALVLHLARILEDRVTGGFGLIVALGLALPLTRPEGIVMALGLILFAAVLAPGRWRVLGAGLGAAITSFVLVTLFRVSYFGQPFPNTFYAKVSSDRLQGIVDGVKYMLSFILGAPFAELYLAALVIATVWGLTHVLSGRMGARGLLVLAAACVGALLAYALLGGDHFVLWRFYQPVAPLLVVPLALGLGAILGAQGRLDRGSLRAVAVAVPLFAIGLSALHYYQSRFDIRKEYVLVEQGLGFGSYLNAADPRPTIGVGPAGGIALAYDGEILDLLGLNWTVMAHANPIKEGMRNHASFHKPTFWDHAPDLVTPFNRPCGPGQGLAFWDSDDNAFDGLYSDADFRAAYRPVTFVQGSLCWPGFAKPVWLATASVPGMTVYDWSDVTILN
ncbi:MAG: hypothetical protein AAGK57_00265 [Pseudomonadota bacterium]